MPVILHGYAERCKCIKNGPSVRLCGGRYRDRCRFSIPTVPTSRPTMHCRRRSTRCYPTDLPTRYYRSAEGRSMTGRVAVIGGGILGAAIAREILQRQPDADVTVIEKRTASLRTRPVATAGSSTPASTTNPVRPKPCCAAGVSASSRRSAKNAGSAESPAGRSLSRSTTWSGRLDDIEARALANGVPGVRIIGAAELRELEPHVRRVAALHSHPPRSSTSPR